MTKVAVVTGAAGGIGAAIARTFAEDGWDVVGVDRLPIEHGYVRDQVTLDLGDPAASLASLAARERVDALVNNAAVMFRTPIADTTQKEWDETLAVNLTAPFRVMSALRDKLAATHGAVVNIASVHAFATSPGAAAYAASKGGLVALTRAAALEFAAEGIRVNAVVPGATMTAMLGPGASASDLAGSQLVKRTPLRRVATPQEIAHAVFFLCDSSQSSFVTGQILTVDGGALAQLSTE